MPFISPQGWRLELAGHIFVIRDLRQPEDPMTTSTEERRRGGIASSQVEYQMRFRDIVSRAADHRDVRPDQPTTVGPFLTISREAGSGGAEVARLVGERLGWAVLDRELVDSLASDLELAPRVLELLDETRANWFSETLLNLFNSRLVAQHSYVELLGKVIALASSAEPVVIVGRGANLILPNERGMCVRIVAPKAVRVTNLARAAGLDETTASRQIDEIDAGRAGFIRRNFHRDVSDSALYDLVVNTGSFGIDGSAELVVRSLTIRGLSEVS
jgi:cytidylate kinase